MRLTTALAFDAAHRLLGHPGRRAYLNGHTYHLEVTVGAEQLDRLGMVIDFDDPKVLVKKAVVDRWDHATLLWSEDPFAAAIAQVQAEAPEKVVRLSGNPHRRAFGARAWQAISQSVASGIVLERVLIRETPTCSAEISYDRA